MWRGTVCVSLELIHFLYFVRYDGWKEVAGRNAPGARLVDGKQGKIYYTSG